MINKESFEWKVLDQSGLREKIRENENARIYIYGAGMVGRNVYKYIKETMSDIIVSNFVTTDIPWKGDCINGVEIIEITKIDLSENNLILLCAKREVRKEMVHKIHDLNIKNFIEITAFDDRDEKYYASIDEKLYPLELCNWYKNNTGKELDLEHPKTFNEKINWSKLYDRNPRKTELSDKYLVREYVEKKIGRKYLIPLLGVWDSVDEIEFTALPLQFVIKCTHGSGWNIFVKDKYAVNYNEIKKKLTKWMKTNFAYEAGLEMQYDGIKPRIIAEKYLDSSSDKGIDDYKFFCFDGKVFCLYKMEEYTFNHAEGRLGFFDRNFNLLQYRRKDYKALSLPQESPLNFQKMIDIAEVLSEGFPHVRVDMYNINGKIYFGEMTFSTSTGMGFFEPEEFDYILGSQWKLPMEMSNNINLIY